MHALVMLHLSSAISENHDFSYQSLLITIIVNESIYHFARYYHDDFAVCYTTCDGDESQLSDCYIEICSSYYYCYSGAVIIRCCKEYL